MAQYCTMDPGRHQQCSKHSCLNESVGSLKMVCLEVAASQALPSGTSKLSVIAAGVQSFHQHCRAVTLHSHANASHTLGDACADR